MTTSCFVEDIKINAILFRASRQNYFLINSDFITAYFLFQAPKQIGRLLYLHRRIGIILNKQKKGQAQQTNGCSFDKAFSMSIYNDRSYSSVG